MGQETSSNANRCHNSGNVGKPPPEVWGCGVDECGPCKADMNLSVDTARYNSREDQVILSPYKKAKTNKENQALKQKEDDDAKQRKQQQQDEERNRRWKELAATAETLEAAASATEQRVRDTAERRRKADELQAAQFQLEKEARAEAAQKAAAARKLAREQRWAEERRLADEKARAEAERALAEAEAPRLEVTFKTDRKTFGDTCYSIAVQFKQRPLGLKFDRPIPFVSSKSLPASWLRVSGFEDSSYGEQMGVEKGWCIIAVDGVDVSKKSYKEALAALNGGLEPLPEVSLARCASDQQINRSQGL